MSKIEEIANICIGDKKLVIIYDKTENSLSENFKTDKDMNDYIIANVDNAFNYSIVKKSKDVYILNIASTENFGHFDNWKTMQTILNNQLSIFIPIIQKFILYVNIGYLD